jgi:muramoyltetrapeptide carboxypeptidase LdcA involved in peptidoglycan recycling
MSLTPPWFVHSQCSSQRVPFLANVSIQIHVSRSEKGEELPEAASRAKKLMHRFTDEEVKAVMDSVEQESI